MKRLGERIKKRREYLHMQLNDLAKKVGISSSALSQIENAKAFPSIVTLKNIADSLHSSVSELIGENEMLGKNPIIKYQDKKFVKKNDSGASVFLISHHDPGKQMETFLLILENEADTSGIMTTHPGQEFCHVLKGTCVFYLDDEKYKLVEGDSIFFNSNVPHALKNQDKKECEILWVVTPPNI
ncbi:MAG: cupin domain-containing protein [Bacteroidales bacterium]|nr:cupin domain-containing protein [Bacteroidales bacterium]